MKKWNSPMVEELDVCMTMDGNVPGVHEGQIIYGCPADNSNCANTIKGYEEEEKSAS